MKSLHKDIVTIINTTTLAYQNMASHSFSHFFSLFFVLYVSLHVDKDKHTHPPSTHICIILHISLFEFLLHFSFCGLDQIPLKNIRDWPMLRVGDDEHSTRIRRLRVSFFINIICMRESCFKFFTIHSLFYAHSFLCGRGQSFFFFLILLMFTCFYKTKTIYIQSLLLLSFLIHNWVKLVRHRMT